MDPRRALVLEEARSFVSTPYHHQGMLKGVGVDCLTLLYLVYQKVGIVPADFKLPNYSREWYMHKSEELYLSGVKQFAREIQTPEPGDAVMYKIGRCVSHGAIIVDDEYVIHAYRKARVVEIAMRRHPWLENHVHSYWSAFS